jgi:hypothetical protein
MATLTPSAALLGPVLGLNAWTFVMEAWMYYERISWLLATKTKPSPHETRAAWEAKQPGSVRWKADNYNHLLEQPTQFYAVALTLALLGADRPADVRLAWSYVAVRAVHSLVQSVGNRFQLFLLSSAILVGMTARAAVLLVGRLG